MAAILSLWKTLRPAAAFDKCVKPHIPRLYRLAWRLTGSESDAEDLLQDTLMRAYPKRTEVLQLDAPGPWLAKVMHNAWVDRWRRSKLQQYSDSFDDAELNICQPNLDETSVMQLVSLAELQRATLTLPEHYRATFIMHDAEGYTLEEISLITGTPIGTQKSRLHRARQKMRVILKEDVKDGTFSTANASQG